MTAQDQQSRAEFEATMRAEPHCWVNRDFHKSKTEGQTYADFCVEVAWKTWQAARALPAGVEQMGLFAEGCRGGVTFHEGETDAAWLKQTLDEGVTGGPHKVYPAYTAAAPRLPAAQELKAKQIDAALVAWFGHDQCLEAGYQYRMRRAIEAANGITQPTGD